MLLRLDLATRENRSNRFMDSDEDDLGGCVALGAAGRKNDTFVLPRWTKDDWKHEVVEADMKIREVASVVVAAVDRTMMDDDGCFR